VAATARKATTRPESQATSYARQKGQQNAMRLGAFLLVVAAFAIPRIPSPIMGVDWWKSVRPSLVMLGELMPPEPIDLGLFTVTPRPVVQWLSWLLAAFLAFVAATLFMHLGALYAQRTRPLGQQRTYLRVTVPASAPGKPTDALILLKSLHGMVPPGNPMQPAAPPLMLCWTARPERKIQQGVSVAGPETLITSVQKRLLGIRSGTKAVATDDPLLAELQPGRFLCVAEARTVAGDALPIAVIGKEHTLLAALLPALAPQAGVLAAGARIIQEPILDRFWRLDVLALLERLKLDSGTDEQQALKAKAAGPAYRTRVMLLAVAEDPQAGAVQVQTIGAALSSSAQAVATSTQRLQAGPVQVFPAVVQAPPPFPRSQRRASLAIGLILATALGLFLWRFGLAPARPLLWAILPLAFWLPVLVLAARWRKRTNADMAHQHAAIIGGLLPPRNPRAVPIWWPWLGRVE
jgi:hypothetical protein